MKTIVKNTSNLTGKERHSCAAMSFGYGGDLLYWMKEPLPGSKTVLVKDDDDKILGWGIRTPDGQIGLWTRSTHRKRGVGKKMVNRLAKIGPVTVKPHSYEAQRLFASTGQINVAEDYEYMRGFEKNIT